MVHFDELKSFKKSFKYLIKTFKAGAGKYYIKFRFAVQLSFYNGMFQ